jgi:hypothetical protein
LWPDTSSTDGPAVWLGYTPPITGTTELRLIAVRTCAADVDQVMLNGIDEASAGSHSADKP